jgi:phosphocarrier protein
MEKIEQEIEVRNPHGLHARPATLFIQIANKYDSSVKLEKNGEAIDGKSIIGILSLGINKGAKVKLIVEGPDAKEAFTELRKFLEKNHA